MCFYFLYKMKDFAKVVALETVMFPLVIQGALCLFVHSLR